MEDAAGVVRRIILLWCEVIIPPCPPSLSSSPVYFWLAAVCVRVCVRSFPLSTHSLQIRKTGNMRKRIWHLCLLYCCQGAQIRARGGHVCSCLCDNIKGVCLCVQDRCLCVHKLNCAQYQIQFPHTPFTSDDTKQSGRFRPALHAERQRNTKNNNGPNKPLKPLQMQHKEIEQEDDLERLHIHADPSSPR